TGVPLREALEQYLGVDVLKPNPETGRSQLAAISADAPAVQELRNPRNIKRVLRNLELVATTVQGKPEVFSSHTEVRFFFSYLAIAERWPEIRAVLQDAGPGFYAERYEKIHRHYTQSLAADGTPHRSFDDVLAGLPNRAVSPDLRRIFLGLGEVEPVCSACEGFERDLALAGL
ncbi:MAG: hypothetical protein IH849_00910, partial [Acidobacteria bacterium]|nr:hypothetical protein [Acidobacteriota bacterium]